MRPDRTRRYLFAREHARQRGGVLPAAVVLEREVRIPFFLKLCAPRVNLPLGIHPVPEPLPDDGLADEFALALGYAAQRARPELALDLAPAEQRGRGGWGPGLLGQKVVRGDYVVISAALDSIGVRLALEVPDQHHGVVELAGVLASQAPFERLQTHQRYPGDVNLARRMRGTRPRRRAGRRDGRG